MRVVAPGLRNYDIRGQLEAFGLPTSILDNRGNQGRAVLESTKTGTGGRDVLIQDEDPQQTN